MSLAWTLFPGQGPDSLHQKEVPQAPLSPLDVRIDVRACSLNARDIMIAMGQSPLPVASELVPLSDCSGVVTEVGTGVSTLEVGDRVVAAFNPAHIDGPYRPEMEPSALGGVAQGALADSVLLPAASLVKLPGSISFEQAACLPCAGVVAWNALFETGPLVPGQTVFATGTGTVSLIALVLAKAAGARFGISSSNQDKIDRAISLGADFGVNYRTDENWHDDVRSATDGAGADVVLETVGPPSIASSIKATAQQGRVAQIGFKGVEGAPIEVLDMMLSSVSVNPVMVGSRRMLESLVRAISANGIEIPVDATYSFSNAPKAFSAAQRGDAFGKVIISNSQEG